MEKLRSLRAQAVGGKHEIFVPLPPYTFCHFIEKQNRRFSLCSLTDFQH